LPEGKSFSAVPVAHMLASVSPDYIAPKQLLAAAGPMFPDLQFALVDGTGSRPMIFATGPVERVAQFEQMADYLDRAPEGVEVQALVLEVTDGKQSGFGLELVLDQLRNGLGLDIGSGGTGDALSFRAGSFSAVLSAVNSDTRVKVVSSPRIRGRSGEALRLQVGADVPVLGAVIENPQGSIAQSVQYRSSGVIFEVSATVYGKRIAVDLRSELSAFAATESGVQGSPTLSTRVLQVALDLQPGEWAVVGGLSSEQVDDSRQSLLGLIPTGRRTTQRKSELVLLVTVNRVGVAPQLPVNNWAGKDGD
jgi:type II secretory pathway component GspD/PulD (secretin)